MLAPLRGKPTVLSPARPGQRATVVIPLLCCHRAPQPGPQRSWVLVGAGWCSDGVSMCHRSCLQAGLQLQDVRSKSSSGGTGAAAHFASPCRVPSAHYAHWYNAWRTMFRFLVAGSLPGIPYAIGLAHPMLTTACGRSQWQQGPALAAPVGLWAQEGCFLLSDDLLE